jgi:hypothetical protein
MTKSQSIFNVYIRIRSSDLGRATGRLMDWAEVVVNEVLRYRITTVVDLLERAAVNRISGANYILMARFVFST